MAATQRMRVSVFFFVDKRCVVRLTKHLSEWSQYASIRFVVHWQLVRWHRCLSCAKRERAPCVSFQ